MTLPCQLIPLGLRQHNARVDLDRHVVFRLDHLPRDSSELNLDVDDPDGFGADVDSDQTRVDGPVELTESADETD